MLETGVFDTPKMAQGYRTERKVNKKFTFVNANYYQMVLIIICNI